MKVNMPLNKEIKPNNLQLRGIKHSYQMSINLKEINLTHREDPNKYYHLELE